MQKKTIVLALGAGLVSGTAQADVDLLGKAVQLYGQLHVSADYYDRGSATGAVPDPVGVEITSNSSRIGFKGKRELVPGLDGVFKFESDVDVSGERGTLSERNRYLGLSGAWGTLIAGVHDTPHKITGSDYTLFGDTVGDRRSILGQTAAGANLFNVRAKSMAQYQVGVAGFQAKAMYSNDFEGNSNPDNNQTLVGAGIGYANKMFSVGAAYEAQESMGGVANSDASGMRVGAKVKFGPAQVGAIYEKLTDDGFGAAVERDAYGVNARVKLADFTLAAQYLVADNSEAATNDGADQYSFGMYYDLAKDAQVYVMYAALDNDDGASYRLARSGHGQSFNPTAAGEKVTAASVGMIYKF